MNGTKVTNRNIIKRWLAWRVDPTNSKFLGNTANTSSLGRLRRSQPVVEQNLLLGYVLVYIPDSGIKLVETLEHVLDNLSPNIKDIYVVMHKADRFAVEYLHILQKEPGIPKLHILVVSGVTTSSARNQVVERARAMLVSQNPAGIVRQVRNRAKQYTNLGENSNKFITYDSHPPASPLTMVQTSMPKEPPFACVGSLHQYVLNLFKKPSNGMFYVAAMHQSRPVAFAVCVMKRDAIDIKALCSLKADGVRNAAVALMFYIEEIANKTQKKMLVLASLSKPYTLYRRLGFSRMPCTDNHNHEQWTANYPVIHHKFYTAKGQRTKTNIEAQARYQGVHIPGNTRGAYVLYKCLPPDDSNNNSNGNWTGNTKGNWKTNWNRNEPLAKRRRVWEN